MWYIVLRCGSSTENYISRNPWTPIVVGLLTVLEGLSHQPIMWREFPWMGRRRPITKKRAGTSDFGSENALQLFSGSSPDHQGREVINLGECLSSPPPRTPPYQFELVFVGFHPPFRFSSFHIFPHSSKSNTSVSNPPFLVERTLRQVPTAWISAFSNLNQTFVSLSIQTRLCQGSSGNVWVKSSSFPPFPLQEWRSYWGIT